MDSSVRKHEENGPIAAAISPRRELGAYEALWVQETASFKTIAKKFAAHPTALPSDFIPPGEADKCAADVMRILKDAGVHRFGIRLNHAGDYPSKLRDARHPIELLYFQGTWELSESRCVAVVGSRNPSEEGTRGSLANLSRRTSLSSPDWLQELTRPRTPPQSRRRAVGRSR
jgi:DNA processing protein